jgi:hypothetical protein
VCCERTGCSEQMLVMNPGMLVRIQMVEAAGTSVAHIVTAEELRIGLVAAFDAELVEEIDTAIAAALDLEQVAEAR